MRKLASIKTINELRPIPNADFLELARVGGWYAVVKKGEFKVGDHAVYIEIDSFVDTSKPQFAFLDKQAFEWRGRRGMAIRTMKLRGQISQGLAMPVPAWPEVLALYSNLDLVTSSVHDWDLTELLGIVKYEEDMHESLNEVAFGKKPNFLVSTSLDRVQNIDTLLGDYLDEEFDVTVKIDGEALSIYHIPAGSPYNDGEEKVGVCSDTIDWKPSDDNEHWKLAQAYGFTREVKTFAAEYPGGVQIMGERAGPGIQKNRYGLKMPTFFVYAMLDIAKQERLSSADMRMQASIHGLVTVPTLLYKTTLRTILSQVSAANRDSIVDGLVEYASGRHNLPTLDLDLDASKLFNWKYDGQLHEGLVFHHCKSDFRFKVISPKYLIKHGV